MKVVGVFGVSGVGKTTLISEVVRREPGWHRTSAGSLIQLSHPDVERDSFRRHARNQILVNQEAIVRGLSDLRSLGDAEVVLLDGHLLIDSDQGPVEIPLDVVRRFRLDAMTFICDKPDQISLRRKHDPNRKRAVRSTEYIAQEQLNACEIVERHARELGIPFATVTPSQPEYVVSFVKGLIRP